MPLEDDIRKTLTAVFAPEHLEIHNESHLHAGHASSPGSGESHFRVVIVSSRFQGRSRVERHRLVNEALAGALKAGVHALSIRALAPGERP